MSFLARANWAFKHELVSCICAKHLIGFVHLNPFARRVSLATQSKDEEGQNTHQPNSCSDATEKMWMGAQERRISGPESHVGRQSSQFIANFSGFYFALRHSFPHIKADRMAVHPKLNRRRVYLCADGLRKRGLLIASALDIESLCH